MQHNIAIQNKFWNQLKNFPEKRNDDLRACMIKLKSVTNYSVTCGICSMQITMAMGILLYPLILFIPIKIQLRETIKNSKINEHLLKEEGGQAETKRRND